LFCYVLGKRHLEFAGYYLLCERMLKLPFPEMQFGWSFSTLQWNLMARSNSISSLLLGHISWEGDALVITIPKHKGDQDGDHAYPRHVYANPQNPTICPVLALAVAIFNRTFPARHSNGDVKHNWPIFASASDAQNQRISELLRKILNSASEDEMLLFGGVGKDDISSHSYSKGAATYVANMVDGPKETTINLRAGWAVPGGSQKFYIFNSGAGGTDAFIGRCLAGLNRNSYQFTALPPHFGTIHLTDKFQSIFGADVYSKFTDGFKAALPFLLASLLHHKNFLLAVLGPTHPLFDCKVFAWEEVNSLSSFIYHGN
jgi:hypothetical protein